MKAAAYTVDVRFGDGVRSVLLALAALLLLAGALAVIRHDDTGRGSLLLLLALGIFALVVPLILLRGLFVGWRAIAARWSGAVPWAGLVLNGALLLFELVVALRAWGSFKGLS